ncbi:MAG: hypothetical protein LBP55_08015 [Candidatus Adiutrix sp.]|jgi:Rod binding domain-containing protein|nr:hypothetical protein [Candidatus Adiutrix sp.]
MSEISQVGDLRPNTVRPLRQMAPKDNNVRQYSVEDLKKGGSLELSGEKAPSLRQRSFTAKSPFTTRKEHNSQLPPGEQIKKLRDIRKSAVEYESVFVDNLVKQMRQSALTKTPGGDTFSEIAEQPFRNFLSQAGGLGLADTIVNQVARQEGLEQTLQENPGIMGPNWHPAIPRNLMTKAAGRLETTLKESNDGHNQGAELVRNPRQSLGPLPETGRLRGPGKEVSAGAGS